MSTELQLVLLLLAGAIAMFSLGRPRTDVVALLFPETPEEVRVDVESGVVRLSGRVRNTELVPVAVRMARAVEGVVAVDCRLLGPRHRPAQEPDLADDRTARDRQAP